MARTIITYDVVTRNEHGKIIDSTPQSINMVGYDDSTNAAADKKRKDVYLDIMMMLKDTYRFVNVKYETVESYIPNR